MKINEHNRKQLEAEFPFLLDVDMHYCEWLVIKPADEVVMTTVPTRHRIIHGGGEIDEGFEVHLYNADGEWLGRVLEQSHTINFTEGGHETTHRGETTLEAIYRLGIVNEVTYALWVHFGYDIQNNVSQDTWRGVLYKPSKELTFEEAVDGAVAQATRELALS